MHPSTYGTTWKEIPDTVLDMKKCLLFFEDPIEVIEGDCGMTSGGCPYAKEERKERWLEDGLLDWKCGELDGGGGVGSDASGGRQTGIERKPLEDRTQESSKGMENRTLRRDEVLTRKAISLNTDNRWKERPLRSLTITSDKALPPPPGEAVSPEPIEGIDPRVVFKMIPDFQH